MRMVKLHEKAYPDLQWLHAIANGGWRRKAVAAKLKAEGVRPGVHDYSWPFRTAEFAGLYIELKSLTGSPSREQRAFGTWAAQQGFRVEYCRGWEQAWKAVCDYAGIPFRVI
jgi:hypothetical protein